MRLTRVCRFITLWQQVPPLAFGIVYSYDAFSHFIYTPTYNIARIQRVACPGERHKVAFYWQTGRAEWEEPEIRTCIPIYRDIWNCVFYYRIGCGGNGSSRQEPHGKATSRSLSLCLFLIPFMCLFQWTGQWLYLVIISLSYWQTAAQRIIPGFVCLIPRFNLSLSHSLVDEVSNSPSVTAILPICSALFLLFGFLSSSIIFRPS